MLISPASAIAGLVRRRRRQQNPAMSQRELAVRVSDETDVPASRDQIARLEMSRPLQFVPELLAGVVRVLHIPLRTVGRALTRDLVAVLRRVRKPAS